MKKKKTREEEKEEEEEINEAQINGSVTPSRSGFNVSL